jgi:hypothetical protein
MADNPKDRGAGDRARVSQQKHEIDYLKRKHGISGQAASAAVRAAGPTRTKIEAHIRAKKKEGSY